MKFFKSNLGVIITIVWIMGVGCIWVFGKLQTPTSMNELGDFLAGAFAPIAFLWLVLGYRQQGKQLDQNTKALEQQEKALQLQIDEMKKSVKQQKELSKIQNQQIESTFKEVKPKLRIINGSLSKLMHTSSFRLVIELMNIGLDIACNMYIHVDLENGREYIHSLTSNDHFLEESILEKNERLNVTTFLSSSDFIIHEDLNNWLFKLRIQYEDKYGNVYFQDFMAFVEKIENQEKFDIYF